MKQKQAPKWLTNPFQVKEFPILWFSKIEIGHNEVVIW